MYWCESDDERWGRANPLISDGGNVRARNLAPLAADRWPLFLCSCTQEQMFRSNSPPSFDRIPMPSTRQAHIFITYQSLQTCSKLSEESDSLRWRNSSRTTRITKDASESSAPAHKADALHGLTPGVTVSLSAIQGIGQLLDKLDMFRASQNITRLQCKPIRKKGIVSSG
jgi:hypothetical protein